MRRPPVRRGDVISGVGNRGARRAFSALNLDPSLRRPIRGGALVSGRYGRNALALARSVANPLMTAHLIASPAGRAVAFPQSTLSPGASWGFSFGSWRARRAFVELQGDPVKPSHHQGGASSFASRALSRGSTMISAVFRPECVGCYRETLGDSRLVASIKVWQLNHQMSRPCQASAGQGYFASWRRSLRIAFGLGACAAVRRATVRQARSRSSILRASATVASAMLGWRSHARKQCFLEIRKNGPGTDHAQTARISHGSVLRVLLSYAFRCRTGTP